MGNGPTKKRILVLSCDGCDHFREEWANDRDGGYIGRCRMRGGEVIPGGGARTPEWCPLRGRS